MAISVPTVDAGHAHGRTILRGGSGHRRVAGGVNDDRLGAAAADPALDRAVGMDDAARARAGRRSAAATATTVATANGRPAASSSAARAKMPWLIDVIARARTLS